MQVRLQNQTGKVTPTEKIDLTTAKEFKQALQTLYDRGCTSIEVDCTHLTMIDSAGLGTLVLFHRKLREKKGGLKITNVQHRYIIHLFDMLELNRVLDIQYQP